jgi:hypothetical protein
MRCELSVALVALVACVPMLSAATDSPRGQPSTFPSRDLLNHLPPSTDSTCPSGAAPVCCAALLDQFGGTAASLGATALRTGALVLSAATCKACGDAGNCPTGNGNVNNLQPGLYSCESGGSTVNFNSMGVQISITYCDLKPTGVIAIAVVVPVVGLLSICLSCRYCCRDKSSASRPAVVYGNPMAQQASSHHTAVEMHSLARTPPFTISTQENGVYSTWFQAAATSRSLASTGLLALTPQEARDFLNRSGLPAPTLAHVWTAVEARGGLTYQQFVMACRLVAMVQIGTAASMSQEHGRAAMSSPLPVFPHMQAG